MPDAINKPKYMPMGRIFCGDQGVGHAACLVRFGTKAARVVYLLLVGIAVSSCMKENQYDFRFAGMNCSLPELSSGVQKPHGQVNSLIFKFDLAQVYSTNAAQQSDSALFVDPVDLYKVHPSEYVAWVVDNKIRSSGRSAGSHASWRSNNDRGAINISHLLNQVSGNVVIDDRRHVVFIEKSGDVAWYETCETRIIKNKRQYCDLIFSPNGKPYSLSIMYTLDKSPAGLAYAEKVSRQFSEHCTSGDE